LARQKFVGIKTEKRYCCDRFTMSVAIQKNDLEVPVAMNTCTPKGLLARERAILDALLPGLDEKLAEIPLAELERPGNPGISLLREAGGASLVIPKQYDGKGASPLQSIRVHRALGSRSPSLAIAATMHNFSIATLVEFGIFDTADESGTVLLSAVANNNLFMASGFAEGRSGVNILAATMTARPTPDGGYLISGSKRPCSLTYSMDLLSASVRLEDPVSGSSRRAVVLIPADSPGIERRPFWRSSVLTGAESDEVILTDVPIPGDLLFFPGAEEQLDPVEVAGYLWFQLLVSASYLGVATGLVERVILADRGGPAEQALLGIEVEAAMEALESVAHAMTSEPKQDLLPRALFARYAAQAAIERASTLACELLGGMAFITSSDLPYLIAACKALAFHPPSRLSSSVALARYCKGGSLQWV
jgi:alkylation response protein AidB-like acyl-CoA dehydrogenase